MQNPPLVSVVIPAYNAAWCIDKALESVFAQSYRPMEVIVVNDGSTDATEITVRRFGERVRLINQPNGGMSNARNTGVRNALGQWVAFLDSDDYWLVGKLKRQMELLTSNPDLGFCSTCAEVVDPDGKLLNFWNCPAQSTSTVRTIIGENASVAGSASAVVARHDLLIRAGLFDESLGGLEDTDMWLRLAAISSYECVDEPLTIVVNRSGSVSRNRETMRQSALRVMKKNRALLDKEFKGRYWQAAYASVLADYAKWEYRDGDRWTAMGHLLEGLVRAPVQRGRLILSLLAAMALGQRI